MSENIPQTVCKLAKPNCYKNCPARDLAVDLQSYWNDGLVEAAWPFYQEKLQRYEKMTGTRFIPE